MLLIFETHPVPYHAPVYRLLSQEFKVPVTVIYGSDFSVAGYRDREFNVKISWDSDLMDGYPSQFLSQVSTGGGRDYDSVLTGGLTAAADALKPDVVMALGYFHRLDRAAIRYAWRRGLPLIFRGETSDTAHLRSALRSMARDIVLRQLYQRCERLLYVGTQAHEHYMRLGCPESSLVFSPYCVDESNFQSGESERKSARAEVRRDLGIADDALVLMFSGKLTPRKGVDLLPTAIRQLPANLRQRCVLLFVGDGSMRQELERECASGPAIPARFVGFQNQTQLSRFYHASDLLVLPSRGAETWGVVVNEALLHGVPCVTSTAVGSHRDLVISGATGEVCAAGDANALSAALKAGLQLGNTAATRERCRAMVAKFSTREAAAGIANAYKAAGRRSKAEGGVEPA